MSNDIATLQLRVQSLEAEVAARRLDRLAREGAQAERATDGLMGSFKRLIGPLAAAAGSVASLSKLVSVTREFEILDAQLQTATGSAEGAAVAFTAIQDFASSTPYDLQQVTDAFTKLVNYGLTPSERALTSYGDTASAMGKELNDLIEAVADAATGEFERLKEFGIKSSKQGDQVKFTFRGVTETVKFEAKAIEEYLTQLGENNFAGAMARRMETLDGAISNLGDEWNKLFVNISNLGVGNAMESSIRLGIDALEELNAMLASGQLVAYLEAFVSKFQGYWNDIADVAGQSLDLITSLIDLATDNWGEEIEGFANFVVKAFRELPENIRAFVQLMVVEVAAFAHSGYTSGRAFAQQLLAQLDGLLEKAKLYGQELWDVLTPWNGTNNVDLVAGFKAIDQAVADQVATIEAAAERETKAWRDARLSSIEYILDERDASLKASTDMFEASRKLRQEFDFLLDSRRALAALSEVGFDIEDPGKGEDLIVTYNGVTTAVDKSNEAFKGYLRTLSLTGEAADLVKKILAGEDFKAPDVLAGFGVKPPDSNEPTDAEKKAAEKEKKRLEKLEQMRRAEFDSLLEGLKTEEEAIADSYNRRLAIIIANTEEGSDFQKKLKEKLDKDFATEALGDFEAPDTYQEQIDALNEYYERRRALILENVQITEEQRTALETELTEQRNQQLAQLEAARTSAMLQTGAQVFDGLAGMAKAFAGEQSSIYRAMFAVSKAFAIADAIVKIQQGIAAAAANPWPLNLAAMASVAASTAGIVSTISSTQFSGAYDEGGHIPSGKFGIVGEYGPEIVQGPANVTSRKDTMDKLDRAAQGGEPTVVKPELNLKVINVANRSEMAAFLSSDDGHVVLNDWAQENQEMFRRFASGGS